MHKAEELVATVLNSNYLTMMEIHLKLNSINKRSDLSMTETDE